MGARQLRVNVPVEDRILLHLWEHDHQADRFMVTSAVTRPGIADACALHPPNVSRSMRSLLKEGIVSEHSRNIKGDERRQKTWQLTASGRDKVSQKVKDWRSQDVLVRDREGTLIEVPAGEAAERLESELTLLQILMHAQHEGVLVWGDIRFGPIHKRKDESTPPPGRVTLLSGAHATYHNHPPLTRNMYGRVKELREIDDWFAGKNPCLVISGMAGIGKSTLIANWLEQNVENSPSHSLCWYPCQPWDTAMGIATSLLHRFGINEDDDRHSLINTLPLKPGDSFDLDNYRRRLFSYLTDPLAVHDRLRATKENGNSFAKHSGDGNEWLEATGSTSTQTPTTGDLPTPPPYWLLVLDDIHHLDKEGAKLLAALLNLASQAPLRLILLSRTNPTFYDRRDVHVRDRVKEVTLKGLPVTDLKDWLDTFTAPNPPNADVVHERTGGHPLAIELLEIFGEVTHGDWLRFLDDEVLDHLPVDEREILSILSVAERPVPWAVLAEAAGVEGKPPENLLKHGLMIEVEDGLWLHEALRMRFQREVGAKIQHRKESIEEYVSGDSEE